VSGGIAAASQPASIQFQGREKGRERERKTEGGYT
jgi:hypothetical protein